MDILKCLFSQNNRSHELPFNRLIVLFLQIAIIQIGNRTLAKIICDENNIPRSVLPVKRKIGKWQSDLFDGVENEK